ncbi:MAG: caspase domain-containing protein [Rhodopirellula sp. JB044]|uniref:caspase family protein n=1 Tax=Rhodopirellula sp. JB044 TaxID=3342844 RepID=UPI00370CAB75
MAKHFQLLTFPLSVFVLAASAVCGQEAIPNPQPTDVPADTVVEPPIRTQKDAATRAIGIGDPAADVINEERQQPKPLAKAIEQSQQSSEMTREAKTRSVVQSAKLPRHALVIGNASYQVGALRNPLNDANAISQALTALGFHVTKRENLNHQEMMEAVSKFSYELPKESLAFFFFAGHGMQLDKNNYLIPVDAQLKTSADVRYRTLPLDYVLDSLGDSLSKAKCVALDCCQNNPFTRSVQTHRGTIQRGLAETRGGTRENMVIFHATHEGLTALDGRGDNSPYTKALVETMSKRPSTGLLPRDVIFDTGKRLEQATGQRAWLNIDVAMPEIYLVPPANDETRPQMASVGGPQPTITNDTPQVQTTDLGAIKMPAETSSTTDPSDQSMNCVELLRQASTYENNGAFDDAMEICSTILTLDRATTYDKRSARLKRASICLTRGRVDDLKMALMDKLACGEKHMQISVRVDESSLMDGDTKKGTIRRNQVATVDRIDGKWIWVKAVQGDSSRHGWTKLTAFVEPAPTKVEPTKATKELLPAAEDKKAIIVNNSAQPWNGSTVTPQPHNASATQPGMVVPYQTQNGQMAPHLQPSSTLTQPYSPSSVQPLYPSSQQQTAQTQSTYQQSQRTYPQPQAIPSGQSNRSRQNYQGQSGSNNGRYYSNQNNTNQRYSNQYQSSRNNSSSSNKYSHVRDMTLGQSQKLIDRNNARRWLPGADQQAITRENNQIREQRQQRWNDFFGK